MSIAVNRHDPTRTKTLRRRYAQRLRGQFASVNSAMREGIQDGALAINAPKDPSAPSEFDFPTTSDKVAGFMDWLRQAFADSVLALVGPDENRWVRTAYRKGLDHANARLRDEAIEIGDVTIEALFNMPVHQDSLRLLYTRNFQQLEGITEAVGQEISRELTEGFAKGWNPRKIARKLSDRIDKVGKHRATILARTEVINAHSEATLNRYEQVGVDEIRVRAEFLTAGDDRVCPICESLEGRIFGLDEIRDTDVTLHGRTVNPQPPVHPQCRCTLIPVTE